jgi:uncharacterized protein (TIGR00369 family)
MYTGGVGALVSDAALGASILCGLEPGGGLATSQLSINFLRPAGPWSGKLTARGRLIHATPTVGLSEVYIEDGNGRLLAHGTSRCFLQRFEVPAVSGEAHTTPVAEPVYPTPDPYLRPVEGVILPESTWGEMIGLEFVQRGVNGQIASPPVALLLGMTLVEAKEGAAVFTVPAHGWLCTPEARVYGGATAYFAHDAMAVAVHTTLPKGAAFATLDLTVNFLRPIRADGRELRAIGRVIHRGRTLAVAVAEVVNADGKTVATATSSSMVLEGRGFPGPQDMAEEFSR